MVVYDGVSYPSWPAVCRVFGVNPRTYAKRLYEQGWDHARAATMPAEPDPLYEHEGEHLRASEWASRLGWPRTVIYKRLQRGASITEIIAAGYSPRGHRPAKLTRESRTGAVQRLRAATRAGSQKRLRRNTVMIQRYKARRACVDCGGKFHPDVMDFDHVRGQKVCNLSDAYKLPREKIAAEIAKCDLVCANCHRMRTRARRQIFSGTIK